jgi:hypothetical protein
VYYESDEDELEEVECEVESEKQVEKEISVIWPSRRLQPALEV